MDGEEELRSYDRAKELKLFDDSRLGVKGLVDSGITAVPRIFRHPPEALTAAATRPSADLIPVIDLSGGSRPAVVDQIRRAASDFGFFQVINHGIPPEILDRTIAAVRAFHELPAAAKAEFYRRGGSSGVSFFSNIDLFVSEAASWRDTLQVKLSPTPPPSDRLPSICGDEVVGWDREIVRLGEVLMGLLSEGLGLGGGRLREMSCLEARTMVGHYYPYCPEPDRTVGIAGHADPGVLTVLLQDQVGGLQVKYGGEWLEVKPVRGALVINVGDLLQIMSNDVYQSVEHRVLANPCREARVSIAIFMNPSNRDGLFGPLPELLALENPAHYRQFTMSDFLTRFFTKGLDGKSLIDYFKLQEANG